MSETRALIGLAALAVVFVATVVFDVPTSGSLGGSLAVLLASFAMRRHA